MVEDDDEETKRLKRAGLLRPTVCKPVLKDGGTWMSGIYISDCLLWLQSEHEGFQCTPYVIGVSL